MKPDLQGVAGQVRLSERATPRQEGVVIANLLQDQVLREAGKMGTLTCDSGGLTCWNWCWWRN